MNIDYIESLMPTSVLRQHERGMRRYFPLKAKIKRGWGYLKETYYIIYGVPPKDKLDIGCAILHHSLDKYVEKFDGRLWVRTIYKV